MFALCPLRSTCQDEIKCVRILKTGPLRENREEKREKGGRAVRFQKQVKEGKKFG